MKRFLTIAAASVAVLGLSALPQSAQAGAQLSAGLAHLDGTRATVRMVSGGYDGFSFGITGRGCGFGHGGGTGYEGCFIYEKGYRRYNGYGRKRYRGRRVYHGDYGHRPYRHKRYGW